MSLLTKIADIMFWRKSFKNCGYSDLSVLDNLNSKLEETVLDTSNISQRIIKKLEAKVHHIQEELSEREELLGHVFSGVSDVLILKDGTGHWKLVNDYGKKILGINGTDYKDKTDLEMCSISPRFKIMYRSSILTDKQTWDAKIPMQFEQYYTDDAGKEIIFDVLKTPVFEEDGSKKHLLVHGKNITEQLTNTKHIRMLIAALNKACDSITVTDHNHIIIYANNAFCDTYEYSIDEVLNKPRNIVVSGITSDKVFREMFKSITSAIPWSGEMTNKTRTGKLLRELVSITPVLNGKPYPIYYIAVNRPITKEIL
jgi:PAS domain S-box-containing protein